MDTQNTEIFPERLMTSQYNLVYGFIHDDKFYLNKIYSADGGCGYEDEFDTTCIHSVTIFYNYNDQKCYIYNKKTGKFEPLLEDIDYQDSVTSISKLSVIDAIEQIKKLPNDNPSYWNKCDVVDRQKVLDILYELIEK